MNQLAKKIETALNLFADRQTERHHKTTDKPQHITVRVDDAGITMTCGGEDSFFDAGYIANLIIADVWKDTVADEISLTPRQAVADALAALWDQMEVAKTWAIDNSQVPAAGLALFWQGRLESTIAALGLPEPTAKEK